MNIPTDLNDKDKLAMLKGLQRAGQQYLTDEDYFRQFERGIEQVKDHVDEGLTMIFCLYGSNYNAEAEKDREAVMPVAFADWPPEGMTKDQAMEALGVLFASQFPDHMLVNITHTSEAWMVERKKDDPDGLAPSKDPNRIEAVIVTATSMDRRTSLYMAKMLRDSAGTFTGLEEMPDHCKRYDPEHPADPRESQDYLTDSIYRGYFELRGIGKKDKE